MDCINHAGVPATTYCQNCGKPFCNDCVAAGQLRTVAGGQILCESCIGAWQNTNSPFAAPAVSGTPSPTAAAILGFIPGVGAMYNGQFVKALIHVAVFVGIVILTDKGSDYFGFFIPAWIFYQVFDAYHTAKARRDGTPLPDPMGLNELRFGARVHVNPPVQNYAAPTEAQGAAYQAPDTTQSPYNAPYEPFQGFPPMPPMPPIPPMPPVTGWRRPEPIGAVILIALGVIFLLGQLDFFHLWIGRFFWPILLIALGVWMIVRRILCDKGASK